MRLTLTIILAVLLSSCVRKQTDVFVFDCTVFDVKTDSPVVGASVTMKVQLASNGFNPNFTSVAFTTTDAQGRFYVEVEKDVFYAYRLEITHPQHFSGTFHISPDDVPISTAYAANFILEPKAWVMTRLLNQTGSQSVSVTTEAESDDCLPCCTSDIFSFEGFPMDTSMICQVYGGQQVRVSGTYVDQNGGVHIVDQGQFVDPFDTAQFDISY